MKQGISSRVYFFLIVINFEVVLRDYLGLADLSKAQTFCIYKMLKIIVIDDDKNSVLAAFEVMTASFESFNNIQ